MKLSRPINSENINLKNIKLLNFLLLNFAMKILLKFKEKILDVNMVKELIMAKFDAKISSLFRTKIKRIKRIVDMVPP